MFACVPGLSTFSGSVQCSCSYLVACTRNPGPVTCVDGLYVVWLKMCPHLTYSATSRTTAPRGAHTRCHCCTQGTVLGRHYALQYSREAQMCYRPRATGTARLADSRSTVGSASGYSTALAGTEAKGRERSRGAGGAMAETRPRRRDPCARAVSRDRCSSAASRRRKNEWRSAKKDG
jgi:hypothetical protein